ncbi:MATE family efflux transporter [Hahella sp. SMD15-11]|uniref:Multidrug-efflux transporter n=1 Tax=Thermohahella caldifontis TaxID=3142973 RepID=A0AB39UYT1_9GAMM
MLKALLSISLPLSAAQLAQSAMLVSDTILMGLMGVDALAGGALGVGAFHFFLITFSGVLFAAPNEISVSYGRKHHGRIVRNLRGGLVVALCLSMLVSLLCLVTPGVLESLGYEKNMLVHARAYLEGAAWIGLPAYLFMLLRGLASGLGDTRPIMILTLMAAVLNVPVSYALMTGAGILPALGLKGIALGTALVHVFLALGMLWHLARSVRVRRWLMHALSRPRRPDFRPYWRLGVPIAVAIGMEMGLFFVAALMAGKLGAVSLAAHQVALQAASTAFNLYIGLAQGTAIRVGHFYGAGDRLSADRVARMGLGLGLVCCTLIAILFVTLPEPIIRLFTFNADAARSAEVMSVGTGLFVVAALFQLADGAQVIIISVLRALHLGTAPTVVTAIGYWLIGVPVAWWLGQYWGVHGIWSGLGIGLLSTALGLGWLYWRTLGREAWSSRRSARPAIPPL